MVAARIRHQADQLSYQTQHTQGPSAKWTMAQQLHQASSPLPSPTCHRSVLLMLHGLGEA